MTTIILKIAKNELRNLFYSPVAWFLTVVFLIQCAIFFMPGLSLFSIIQDQLLLNDPNWKDFRKSMTAELFLNFGLIERTLGNLYLLIPLLTMGLLSREVNNGTIKLLYSSPIKLREIVLGKYLAVMIFNLLLLSILGLFMVTGIFTIKSADVGLLLAEALGFYLLICAYSAIGLFMSSLTTYQIVSGIGSFVIIFILSQIGTLWQKYDFVRDLTYFLSIAGRTSKMVSGLITTKDVIYFLTVIFMFLSFTLFKLKSGHESKPWHIKAARYVITIMVCVIFGYITSRPALVGYWDTTAAKTNTIHPRIQKLLASTGKEPLEVTLYTNLFDNSGLRYGIPESRNAYLSDLWDKYLRFKPDIDFKYVYYYDNDGRLDDRSLYKQFPHKSEKQIAGIIAEMNQLDESLFVGPSEIRKIIDPYVEDGRLYISIRYRGRIAHARTFNDPEFWPNEQNLGGALKNLVEGNVPKIYFLTGNLERSIIKTGEREYSKHAVEKINRTALINMGFSVDTLSLESRVIPADVQALVIADPKTSLSAAVLDKLKQYIYKGGNLLVFGEPGKQDVLNPVLKELGVQLQPGVLVHPSKNETPDKVLSYGTDESLDLAEENSLKGFKELLKATIKDTLKIVMPGATAITYDVNGPFRITPIMTALKHKTWRQTRALVTDSVPPVFSPALGDLRDTFITGIQLSRQVNNKEQRIIVCGDADFKSNLRFYGDWYGNAFYSWLDENQYPIYVPSIRPLDVKLTIGGKTASALKIAYVWILPGLLVLLGGITLIIRKRK